MQGEPRGRLKNKETVIASDPDLSGEWSLPDGQAGNPQNKVY